MASSEPDTGSPAARLKFYAESPKKLYAFALFAALAFAAQGSETVLAQSVGGHGGGDYSSFDGGSGGSGVSSPSNQGGNGSGSNSGGGGGGGGAGGGLGGAGGGGAGGTGGTAAGAGGNSTNGGGGGGGGGDNGFTGTTISSPSTSFTGQDGGQGGSGSSTAPPGGGGGGGGGAGGYGVVVTGSSVVTSTSATLTGGAGGLGGIANGYPNNNLSANNDGGFGGNGGGGGVGAYFSGTGVSFTNGGIVIGGAGGAGGLGPVGGNGGAGGVGVSLSNGSVTNTGTITGGNGGGGGQSSFDTGPCCVGANGAGGVGIFGAGLTIINSGSIAGGTGASAITFTGGTNFLDIVAGSSITGNVVAFSTADTFTLTGATNSTFNVSSIGPSAQYQGFGAFDKTGVSIWTLTGTPGQVTPWTVSDGTLKAGASTNVFGSTSAITVSAPGTLDLAGFSQQIGSLAGAGTVTNSSTTTAATLSTNAQGNASTTFSGNITDTGTVGTLGLTKQGTGTLTLSGSNSYHGATTVSAGTLQAGSTGAFSANSAYTVTSTLDVNGFSNTIGSLAGGGTVTNSSTITAATLNTNGTGNASTTFSGNITDAATSSGTPGTASAGSLGLTKTGTGTLTLSGSNTYHGDTNVSAGTLQAGSTGAFSANSNFIVAGGTTLDLNGFNNTVGSLGGATGGTVTNNGFASPATLTAGGGGSSTTFAGVIQDGTSTTALTKTGTGTMTLSNANTYSGATTVSAGTLALSGSGSIALSSLVTVGTGGATATFDISGTSGASIKSLAGASDGIVALGSYDLTITAGSTTFAGVISGNAGIEIAGGTQTLSGINTYGNYTFIDNGATLALKGNGSIANSPVELNGTGVFDISQTTGSASINGLSSSSSSSRVSLGAQTLTIINGAIFDGVIQDGGIAGGTGGGLIIGANAFQVLEGTNTYTGATTVNGTLGVEGSIATSSLTTVNANGFLSGGGAAGAIQVNANGTFAPGADAPGTFMTVSSLSMAGGAFYQVQLNPTTSSFANVTGNATLGGATVEANFASGSYVSKQYTILTAGSISDMFNPTVANTGLPSGFHDTVSYNANDAIAYLNLVLNFAPPPGSGLNANQQSVGNAIINFFNSNGSIPLVFGGLTAPGLTQISGETATGSQQTTFDAMNQFMGVMTDPFIDGRGDVLSGGGSSATGYASTQKTGAVRDANAMFTKAMPAAPTFDQRWSVWAAGYGGSQTTSGNAALGSNDATSRIYGTAVGADYRFSPFTIAGFALAGGGTSFSVANAGTGRSDLFQAGAFVRHTVGPAYISAALAYGWQDVTTNRTVTVAGTDMLQARFNANAWSGRLEGGYRYATPWMGVTPYAAAQFTTFELPAYAEGVLSGAGTFALAYAAKSVTDTRSELGIRTDKSWAMTDSILTLRGRLAWAHDYDPDRSIAATFQALPGASFVVNGAAQAHDSALTTASAEIKWTNGWSAAATFEGEFSSVTNSYAGKGVVRYAW